MEHLIQPNGWSCLPTAFAMVLQIPVEELIRKIGHDGSEKIFPELDEPYCRKGFHIQELIDRCMLLDYSVTPIEGDPIRVALDGSRCEVCDFTSARLQTYLENYIGVCTGTMTGSGHMHACAWDGVYLLDPKGFKYPSSKMEIETFWIIR